MYIQIKWHDKVHILSKLLMQFAPICSFVFIVDTVNFLGYCFVTHSCIAWYYVFTASYDS